MTRPVFIIHDLSHAMAVASVAVEMGRRVTVRSAPGLATTLGPEGFMAILQHVEKSCGQGLVSGVLDCGIEPGTALGALRRGVKMIAVDLDDALLKKISDIARQHGAGIYHQTRSALDLLDLENMDRAIHHYIADRTPQ